MVRGWMLTLGLAALAVVGAIAASASRDRAEVESAIAAQVEIEASPCVRYGRFECCVKPEE